MATGAEYRVIHGILRIDFSLEKAKVVLRPKTTNADNYYANLLHIGINVQNVVYTKTQIVIDNRTQDSVTIQWPNQIDFSGVIPEILKADTIYVLGLTYYGDKIVVGEIIEGDRNTYEEIDDIVDVIEVITGLTHTEDLNLLAANQDQLWTYIGVTDAWKVVLPDVTDLVAASLNSWQVSLRNASFDESDITIEVFDDQSQTLDGVASIPYPYGTQILITWNGDDTFSSSVVPVGSHTHKASEISYDPTDDPTSSETDLQALGVDHGKSIEQRVPSSSGVIIGGILTLNTPTTFDISAGNGEIHDNYTTPENTSINELAWAAMIGVVADMGATSLVSTKIFIDSNGAVVQNTGTVFFSDFRDKIFLGVVYSKGGVIVDVVNSPAIIKQTSTDVRDLLLVDIAINDARIFPVDDQLQLWIEQGTVFFPGANWYVDKTSPNLKFLPQQGDSVTPITFTPMFQDGSLGAPTTDLPKFANPTGTTLDNLQGNNAAIHRLYSLGFDTGRELILLYGQNEYNNAQVAKDNVLVDNAQSIFPAEVGSMQLLGQVCLSGNSSDFDDLASAWIISGALQEVSSGGISTKDRFFESSRILTEEDCGLRWIYTGTGVATLTLPLISAYSDTTCRFRILNLANGGAILTILVQGPDTMQDFNANYTGLVDIPVVWGQERLVGWDTPNAYYQFLLDWYINTLGDLIPDSNGFQFIGDETRGPRAIVLHETTTGIKGLVIALDTSEPNFLPYITLLGNNVGEIGDPVEPRANAPVVVWGQPIMLKSDGGVLWGFGTQGQIPPASIEDHYMLFGPVQNTSDGDQFSQVVIGPQLAFLFEDTASSIIDYDVEANEEIVVSHILVNGPYVDPSSISFSVFIENLSAKDTIFAIRIFHNAIEIYAHPLITLQGNNQLVSFSLPLNGAPLPFNPGDTIDLRVDGLATSPQSEGWVRGSVQPTKITVKQEPQPAAFGAEVQALGIDNNYRSQYRITNVGPHTLPDIYEWRSRGINAIAFKNTLASPVILNAAVGDVINWREGYTAETSITIPPHDSIILGLIDEHIWEVHGLSANQGDFPNATKYHYVQAGLPFTTSSQVYVVATTDTTPVMEKGQYKVTINASLGCTAANRSFNVIALIDAVQVNVIPYIKEPKDATDRFPISYTFIMDWTALTETHDIEVQIKKDGGGGGADVQLHDWRYQVERWSD